MIRGVIIMNDQGKPRLVKFYEFQPVEKQQELIRSIYRILCSRAENVSNFVKVDSLFGKDVRLVYKTYATLYVVFIFDNSENELAMLDLMQVFVETMDRCFSNVCEIDVVFNFNKIVVYCNDGLITVGITIGGLTVEKGRGVPDLSPKLVMHTLLDEIILGGQVLETNSSEIVKAVEEILKLERHSNSSTVGSSISGRQGR